MGRWVLSIVIIAGILMGGSLYWILKHRDQFRAQALQGLVNDFQPEKDVLIAKLPADLEINPSESWSLMFEGDELWISVPTLEKKTGGSLELADFDRARAALLDELQTWLSHRPGDSTKFPVQVRFRNEPMASPASDGK